MFLYTGFSFKVSRKIRSGTKSGPPGSILVSNKWFDRAKTSPVSQPGLNYPERSPESSLCPHISN